jgi:hypothetical protein
MSMSDAFFIVVALVSVVIVMIATGIVFEKFNGAISASDVSQVAKDNVAHIDSQWPGAMDWLFASILFGLPLVSMALAHFNSIPSIFFYLTLALLFLMAFVSYAFQGAWESLRMGGTDFSVYAVSRMPITDFVMSNFGLYGLLIIAIIGYGTYVKLGGADSRGF